MKSHGENLLTHNLQSWNAIILVNGNLYMVTLFSQFLPINIRSSIFGKGVGDDDS